MDTKRKEKTEIKVYVRMHDGSRLLGNVFLAPGERLQDIMNDDRTFIPVHVDEQNARSLVMLSKRYIQQVEEVRADIQKREAFFERYERRQAPSSTPTAQVPSGGLKLELDDNPFGRRKDDKEI